LLQLENNKREVFFMKKKLSILAVIAILAVASFATLAYLTDSTGEITNIFTVGDLDITLTETYTQNSKIYPGATISKTPVVTVLANSEPSFLYVMVDNQLSPHGVLNILPANWVSIGANGTRTVYRYTSVVPLSVSAQTFTVFSTVSFSGSLTNAQLATLKDKNIVIKAYAHQEAGVDQSVADAAAITHFTTP